MKMFIVYLMAAFTTCTLTASEQTPRHLEAAHSCNRCSRLYALDTANVYSQVSQDTFVYLLLYGLLEKKDKGNYLEIGAGEPQYLSNSYFFEQELNWSGTSIDISDGHAKRWKALRKNRLLTEDATKSDYRAILQSFPKTIDYLSLDVDSHYTDVLKRIPFDEHLFKVITIEHDFYRYGDLYRTEERQILESLGYYLLCPDVSNGGLSFEDWWIHPAFFSDSQLAIITSLDLAGKEYTEIIQRLRAALEKITF